MIRSTRRAFVIMPFGKKKAPDGTEIDFDLVYKELLAPAIMAAGLTPHRADADRRAGSIHPGMFQDLLLAEFVVADLTLDNPNVWYEIGVRHALRASGTLLAYALRDRLPFDLAGQRMQLYTLNSVPRPRESAFTTDAIGGSSTPRCRKDCAARRPSRSGTANRAMARAGRSIWWSWFVKQPAAGR